MSEWQPMRTAPSDKPVLVRHKNALGKWRVIKAEFVPAFSVEATTDELELSEYNHADDEYYWREGWYECVEHWDDVCRIYVPSSVEMLGWQPLPDPGPSDPDQP